MKVPCMICGHWLTSEPYVFLLIGKTCLAKSFVEMGEGNKILTEVYKLKCGNVVKKEVGEFVSLYKDNEALEQFKKDFKKDLITISQNEKNIVSILKKQVEIEFLEKRLSVIDKNKGEKIIISDIKDRINGLRLIMGTSLKESSWVSPIFKVYHQ